MVFCMILGLSWSVQLQRETEASRLQEESASL